MSTKPTFFFVPGAWHLPAYFDPLIKYLSSHGYPSVAVTLPGVNSSPAVDSIQADVSAAADALTALLDSGADVVAVFHSYGGMVGTDAVGKVVKERAGKQSGKLRRLVYVSAYVPLEGQTTISALDGAVDEPRPFPDHLILEVRAYCSQNLLSSAISPFLSHI
jgi:pimeloyl-ACP methyl ester carboxylesterase